MKKEVVCQQCHDEVIIIENKLFFSDVKNTAGAICPTCSTIILTIETDGWLFVQTKNRYLHNLILEESKKTLVFPMP